MTNKADRIALRALITLFGFLGGVVLIREYVVSQPLPMDPSARGDYGEAEATPTPRPRPIPKAKPIATVLPARNIPAQPEIRRAMPVVRTTSTPGSVPKRLVVTAPPKVWSRLVEIPDGKEGTITFSLGRLRIERNGVDLGIVYRKRSIEGTVVNGQPEVTKVDMGAFFDKTPRTLTIDPGTRTLRFSSMERTGGAVVVDFSP